ncbi:MAG: type II toxin-antitoxin system VapC family toxin [Ignavibacteriae bacterium]|nr:type II toxin-antitoxin system VapC family toxin [Ignavibacteriota bacterium]
MPAHPNALVLDSWSMIAYLEDEPAGERVADIIADARTQRIPLWVSVVNASEVWYTTARQTSASEADNCIALIRSLGVKLDNAEWPIARQAGMFKSKYKMSLADCFAAALARQKDGHLVTGDPEFKRVAGEIKILWLPFKVKKGARR